MRKALDLIVDDSLNGLLNDGPLEGLLDNSTAAVSIIVTILIVKESGHKIWFA